MSETAEIAKLRAALAASEARTEAANSALLQIRATVGCAEAMIKELKLEIAKLRRDKYGVSSERSARLLDQLELQLEELEAAATEDALAAEQAQGDKATVKSFTRRKPTRKPFPEHLPRERVVVEAPTQCTCCGSDRIVKMGEDVTDTLEVIPRQWKVVQTVREKLPGLRPFMPQNVHRTFCRLRRAGAHHAGRARRSARLPPRSIPSPAVGRAPA